MLWSRRRSFRRRGDRRPRGADNSGKIDVSAIAQASGGFGAPALAEATGIVQLALTGTDNLVNSGTIAVTASAKATDTGSSAFVGVDALGILQVGHDSLNQLDNSGSLTVKAVGEAGGLRGYEAGSATGFYVRGDSAELDVSNSGTIDVEALGTAPNGARMEAIGIRADAIGGSAATATQPALISGSIVNSGTLHVMASANGAGPLVTTTFSGATLTLDQSSAQAIGVSMYVGSTDRDDHQQRNDRRRSGDCQRRPRNRLRHLGPEQPGPTSRRALRMSSPLPTMAGRSLPVSR